MKGGGKSPYRSNQIRSILTQKAEPETLNLILQLFLLERYGGKPPPFCLFRLLFICCRLCLYSRCPRFPCRWCSNAFLNALKLRCTSPPCSTKLAWRAYTPTPISIGFHSPTTPKPSHKDS